MEDKFEKKLKQYLVYMIIIAAVYLFSPILLNVIQGGQRTALTEVVFLGVYPLTTLLCNLVFAAKLKTPNVVKSDFMLALIGPIVFIPTIFIYGLARSENGGNVFTVILYLLSYLICGLLGLYIGEFLKPKKVNPDEMYQDEDEIDREYVSMRKNTHRNKEEIERDRQRRAPRATHVPRRVREEVEEANKEENDFMIDDNFGDQSTTMEDIDAILREIHERNKE